MSWYNPRSWFAKSGTITPLKSGTNGMPRSGAMRSDNLAPRPEPKDLGQIVRDMRSDYQVSFCERILNANINAIQVKVTSDEVTEELAEALQTLWDRTLASMADSIAYGRVAYELEWSDCEGYQVPEKCEPLPFEQSRMRLENGHFAGIELKPDGRDWDTSDPIVPANAWWLAIDATVVQPHGRSRFVPAPYEVWKDKRGAKNNRRTATSKWALRGPIIRGPITEFDEQTQQNYDVLAVMAPAVDEWSKGALLYLPNDRDAASKDASEFKFAVEQSDLQGFDPNALNATIERLDVEIARSFGIAEQTIMEAGGVGTYGSITQKMLLLFAVCEGILDQWCRSFERYVIGKTLAVNGLPKDSVTLSYTSLAQRPDAFVFEVVKALLANPSFVEGLLGGADMQQLLEESGLPVNDNVNAAMQAIAQRLGMAAASAGAMTQPQDSTPAGEMSSLGRRQFQNNTKAIKDILSDFIAGNTSEAMARELLQSIGLPSERAQVLIDDAKDGTIDDASLEQPAVMSDGNADVGFFTLFDESKVKRDKGKFSKKEGGRDSNHSVSGSKKGVIHKKPSLPPGASVYGSPQSVARMASEWFGSNWNINDVAGLFGAIAKSAITVTSEGNEMKITAFDDDQSKYRIQRTLRRDSSGMIECENDLFISKNNGSGLGAKVFVDQVSAMTNAGVSRITTFAARDATKQKNAFVGYKVWPKFGYDGPIPSNAKKRPVELAAAKTIQQLYSMPGGREWWESNGKGIDLSFDLSRGSSSRQILAAYLRKKRSQTRMNPTAMAMADIQEWTDDPESAEDRAILLELWNEIVSAGGVEAWAERDGGSDSFQMSTNENANLAVKLAQVPIPRQGFKVPTTETVLNAGLREFDRLFGELVDAMSRKATKSTINGIRNQILSLNAELRTVGRLLGMLSPWQPRAVSYADGDAAKVTAPLPITLADNGYKFPWIEDAVSFLESKGVISASDFAALSDADKRTVFSAPGIDSTAQLNSIKTKLAKSLEAGDDLRLFRKSIEADVALTRAQTETMYRTETKRGYVAGLDKALASPLVKTEFPAVMFSATSDQRVRDLHWDLDGFVCLRSDPAYKVLKNAAGDFSCRCGLIPLSMSDAESYGIKTYDDLPTAVRAKYA